MDTAAPTENFIPSLCRPIEVETRDAPDKPTYMKTIAPDYEGFVKIRVPDYEERQQFFLIPELDSAIEAAAKAKLEGTDVREAVASQIDTKRNQAIMKNVRRQLKDWVVEINIKRLDDGFVFTTLDEVRYDTDVGSVIKEITLKLLGKFRWGNPNAPKV